MIKKIIAYQISEFDDPIDEDSAYECSMESTSQDEFDRFVFDREIDGVWTCDEVETVVEKFHREVILTPKNKTALRNIIHKQLFTSEYE